MECKKYDMLTLLSYVTGDLSDGALSEMEIHLRDCSICTAYVADVKKEQAAFLETFPSISVAKPPVRERLVRFPALRTVLALAAVLVIAVGTGTLLVNHHGEDYRTKGGVALKLFVQDSAGVPLECAVPVCTPGERIQFTYSCGGERYFMLMSVDTSGAVSVFYPEKGDSSIAVEPGNDLPLPNSIVLDDYIGKEWYVAVFSAHPLSAVAVTGKLRGAIRKKEDWILAVPDIDHATVKSILLTKRGLHR